MSVRIRRGVVAGVAAVAAVAVPAVAVASGPPSGKPAPPPSAASNSPAVESKSVTGSKPRVDPSAAAASKAAAAASEPRVDRSMTGSAAVAALAGRLGVSRSAAERALQQIAGLGSQEGVDQADTALAVIAHDLGVSPARLAAALGGVKQAVAGK
jgi:hypothetical protein